ncbi:MAG: hypothetical protein F6K42_24800 [Leptolyngbya sp. SIO1D8]|nr:hypothetical protein [Leptolyngbya sp. SIO1D8]
MTVKTAIEQASDLAADDYLVVGVASCYHLEDGDLKPIQVLEPIPSAYLESILQGVPTSYQLVCGTTLGAVMSEEDLSKITGIPQAQICQNFADRVVAAARTYQSRPAAKALVALGETRTDINHSTEKKRVLNLENIVTAADNVRQHEYTHKTL